MTEFHGGIIPAHMEVWTVTFGTESVGYEELDVMAPVGSAPADVRAIAAPIIAADYLPGMQIVDVSPFRGVTVRGA
ncbi:hypothetical protein [Gordonia jacobaea]|uniref:hypothetical protein n=1 Tax=Gordonia jacobaea TaxID=122202 RepID=UPI0022E3BEE4|nr:hypothetical protein [Gordonia jacobaea]